MPVIADLEHVDVHRWRALRVIQRERRLRLTERPGIRRDAVVRRAIAERAAAGDERPGAVARLRIELNLRVVVQQRRAGHGVDDVHRDRLGHTVDAEIVVVDRELGGVRARVRLIAQRLDLGLRQVARDHAHLVDVAVEHAREEIPVLADIQRQRVLRQRSRVVAGRTLPHAVDVDALGAGLICDRDVVPGVQRDRVRRRDRARVAAAVVPPPVHVPAVVDVKLVVRVLRHDRVELGRRRAQVDPGRDGQLARDVHRRIVRDLDVLTGAAEGSVAARAGIRRRRGRRVGRRGSTDGDAVQTVGAGILDLTTRPTPRRLLEAHRQSHLGRNRRPQRKREAGPGVG